MTSPTTAARHLLPLDDRARPEAPALLLQPEDDPCAVPAGDVPVIGIAFPRFRDGRGYSLARILRERGFAGDLRAVGDVTVDQLLFLARAGFSSVAPDRPIAPEAAAAALARYPVPYQRGRPGEAVVWERRQAAAGGGGR